MKQRAFTLIELVIVMAIAGLALTGALKLLSTLQVKSQYTETENYMDIVDSALIGYAAQQDADPDGKPGQRMVYLGSTPIGNAACDCRYDDGGIYPSETFPGINVTGCDNICSRKVARTLPYADSDGDGSANGGELSGTVPWDTIGLPESYTYDYWGNSIEYTVDSDAVNEGIHSGLSGTAFTLRSAGGDIGGEILRPRSYVDIVGFYIKSGTRVD